jgi:hypothetical protein
MAEPRTFASLSPRLLARKGGAKPAMRRQVQSLNDLEVAFPAESQDDLGWNDMGDEADTHGGSDQADADRSAAEVVALHGAVAPHEAAPPKIVASQRALAARIEKRPAANLQTARRRAAFTLRIDPDRHLQLRLASTVSGRSAQALLTEALDQMLEDMPEIRSLAENVRKRS